MKKIKFKAIYWQQDWIENAVIHYDDLGVIKACSTDLNFDEESDGYQSNDNKSD